MKMMGRDRDGGPDTGDGSGDFGPEGGGVGGEPRIKYYVNDEPVMVVAERVQYYGPDGKLITESLRDYTKKRVLSNYSITG